MGFMLNGNTFRHRGGIRVLALLLCVMLLSGLVPAAAFSVSLPIASEGSGQDQMPDFPDPGQYGNQDEESRTDDVLRDDKQTELDASTSNQIEPADVFVDASEADDVVPEADDVVDTNPVGVFDETKSRNFREAFPDPNFREAVLDLLNESYGGNRTSCSLIGEADETLLAGIKVLSIRFRKIEDLTGIEYFTGLIRLYVSNNRLTSLELSKNTALTTLECESNELTQLDLSRNIALEYVTCGSNKLVTLDMSNNPSLKGLHCAVNQLHSLNVSNNPMLDTLMCYSNKLTELDVSNNPDLAYFACNNNLLTELKLAETSLLTELYCDDNQLAKLDLSKSPGLRWLSCDNNNLTELNIAANTALQCIRCSGNMLSELDTSNNPALRFIYCNNNLLTGLDVSANSNLLYLHCYDNYIASPDAINGWQKLGLTINSPEDPQTGSFRFYNQLTKPELRITFREAFPDANFRLIVLDILNVDSGGRTDSSLLGEEDEAFLAAIPILSIRIRSIEDLTGIEYFTGLTELYVSRNLLTSLDLSKNKDLKTLECNSNKLIQLDLSGNMALEYVSCGSNQLVTLDISNSPSLRGLHCEDNQLRRVDVSNNPMLEVLMCYSNKLTELDVSKNNDLAHFACDRNLLTELDITNNSLLEELYCTNNQLASLDLSNNPSLFSLYCSNNRLTELDLSATTVIQVIQCDGNMLTELDTSNNPALRYIYCNDNLLTVLDVSENKNLIHLCCSENYMASPDDVIGWQDLGLTINTPESLLSGSFLFYQQKEIPATKNKRLVFDVNEGFFRYGSADGPVYTGQPDKWQWEAETRTLILDGFSWEANDDDAGLDILNGNITIDVRGENAIKVSGNPASLFYYAIGMNITKSLSSLWERNSLKITGDGTLRLEANSAADVEKSGYFFAVAACDFVINMTEEGALNITLDGKTRFDYAEAFLGSMSIHGGAVNISSIYNASNGYVSNSYVLYKGSLTISTARMSLLTGDTLILPDAYRYWVNTTAQAPAGSSGKEFPGGEPLDEDMIGRYRYIKIEAKPSSFPDNAKRLDFQTYDGAFYLSDGTLYTGQSDKWSWDADTKTLTLDGFVWETANPVAMMIPPSVNNTLTINVKGINTLQSKSNHNAWGKKSVALFVPEIIFTGDGALSAISESGEAGGKASIGINGTTTITVDMAEGGTINAYGLDNGISSRQSCSMIMKNGVVNASARNGYAINLSWSIEVSGGVVNAIGLGSTAGGIRIHQIDLDGGVIHASARGSSSDSHGIFTDKISIRGGALTAEGGASAAYIGYGSISVSGVYGPYRYWLNEAPGIEGAKVYTYPDDGQLIYTSNQNGMYKYLKIEPLTQQRVSYREAFPDSNFRSVVLEILNADGGGRTDSSLISEADEASLAIVPKLSIRIVNIEDLTGIEYFTGLVGLYVSSNRLTSLDLSKNTTLTTLECNSNKLTSLDLSSNTALDFVYCESNQLLTLDISNNPSLRGLHCAGNQLQRLDVSNNPMLESFMCDDNKLTELDVSNNPDLLWLACDRNMLTELDISKNSLLEELYCSNNQLTKLDLSQNPALRLLYCSNNRLTELDLSAIPGIQVIQCDGNTLTELDTSNNPALRYIYCNDNLLTGLDVSSNNNLFILHCPDNYMTSPDDVIGWQDQGLTINSPEDLPSGSFRFYNQLVKPIPVITITEQPTSRDIIIDGSDINGDLTLLIAAELSSGGSLTFTWYKMAGKKPDPDTDEAISSGASYTIQIDDQRGMVYYYCVVSADGAEDVISDVALVVIKETESGYHDKGLVFSAQEGVFYLSDGTVYTGQTGKWSWDSDAATLALNDFEWISSAPIALEIKGAVTINVTGINTIGVTGTQPLDVYGIYAMSALTITGNGTLIVSAMAKPDGANVGLYTATTLTINMDSSGILSVTADSTRESNGKNTGLAPGAIVATREVVIHDGIVSAISIEDGNIGGRGVSTEYFIMNGGKLTAQGYWGAVQLPSFDTYSLPASYQFYVLRYLSDPNSKQEGVYPDASISWFARQQYVEIETILPAPKITFREAFPDPRFRGFVLDLLNDLQPRFRDDDSLLVEQDKLMLAYRPSLYIYDLQIMDLTGIEYFSGLQALYCNNNDLTTLDLSHNTALTILWCYGNKLETLDLSNCARLTDLWCSENELSRLDVSVLPELTTLWCERNNLAELDLSANAKLIYLDCSVNLLTDLSVANNLDLEELWCYGNWLTELDVSRNAKLIKLRCANNLLTELDISNNTELADLRCDGNLLTKLDVTRNKKIKNLFINDNYLTSPDDVIGWEDLGLFINDPESSNFPTFRYYNQRVKPTLEITFAEAFPDGNFRSIVLDLLNEDGGGRTDSSLISEADKASLAIITKLSIRYRRIEDLTGIEYFTGLTGLYVYGNLLTSIDLSKNTALTFLECDSNSLACLDLSRNTALEYVSCAANQLVTLDISNNPSLTGLHCAGNQLQNIDVSNNPLLENLMCYDNKLTELDVSNNHDLKWFACDNNLLTELNLMGNPLLIELYCSINQLAKLDLSNNTALTSLYCGNNCLTELDLPANSVLERLSCGDNMLSELDISKNPALRYLYCNDNLLTGLDVSFNNSLAYLACYNNYLSSPDDVRGWQDMGLTINSPEALLNGNFIFYNQHTKQEPGITFREAFPDPGFRGFILDLLNDLQPRYRDDDSLLDEQDIMTLAYRPHLDIYDLHIKDLTGIEYFPGLQALYCNNNELTTLDLSQNTALTTLWCYGNKLETVDMSNCLRLTDLWCSYNALTELDVSLFPELTTLWCERNNLTELDLSANTKLINLDCGGNLLTSLSVANNADLEVFWCYDNALTALDVSNNVKLSVLRCPNNLLTELDISNNTELTDLRCEGNLLTKLDITQNQKITNLFCNDNYFTSPDDVIGWADLGLLINDPEASYFPNFRYYNQRVKPVPLITITEQPVSRDIVIEDGEINGDPVLYIAAEVSLGGTVAYTWYERLGDMPDQSVDEVVGAGAAYSVPVFQIKGTFYYYCVARSEGAVDVVSDVARVVVLASRKLISIDVSAFPDKIVYFVGEPLDLTGMVITVRYSDGITRDITSLAQTDPVEGTALYAIGAQLVLVYYSEGDVIETAHFRITVNQGQHVCDADDIEITIPATCETNGLKTYRCSICGEINYTITIPKLGHNWDAGVVTTQPTQEVEGLRTYTCVRCYVTRAETVPKLPSKISVNGVELSVSVVNGVATLNIAPDQMSAILRTPGTTIEFNLQAYAAVDIYVDASAFSGVDKTLVFITSAGKSSVKTKSLWNNSGKQRLITIRNNALDYRNA